MKLLILLASFGLTTAAFAQSSSDASSTVNVKDVAPAAKKGDIDDEITNARLRAVTGAKTNWSYSSNFNYAGSAINTPFSSTRPQLNSQNNADPTNINGQMAIKYRATQHDSLLLGFGLQYTPAYTDPSTNSKVGAQTSASSPYLDYNRAFRVGISQHSFDTTVSKYTLGSDTQQNLNWSLGVSDQMMFDIGKTALELGGYVGYSQDFYSGQAVQLNDDGIASPAKDYLRAQFVVEPVAEYALSEKTSLRTVYRMLILNQSAAQKDIWTQPTYETESFGVGYAATRDIYLYPNMQWSWSYQSQDKTTVGFTANINL